MNETNAERFGLIKESGICLAIIDLAKKKPWPDPSVDAVVKDVAWLVEQTERVPKLEKQLHKMKALPMLMELDRRRYENEKLCEALEFYANAETYKTNVVNQWEPIIPVNRDSGKLARQTLKGVVRNGETWS